MRLGVLLVPLGVPRLDLCNACGLRRDTASNTLTTQMAQCALRPVEPTAVFGGIMAREFLRDSLRLRGIKCCIKSGFGMGMQSVHQQTQFLHVGRMLSNKFFDQVGPINCCALRSALGIPLTRQGFKSHKNVCRSISLRLWVISQRLPRLSGERSTDFAHQRGGHCIYRLSGNVSCAIRPLGRRAFHSSEPSER
jgi:hypothetical protein